MQYNQIFEFDTLYKAYLAARKGKRNKRRTLRFEADVLSNLAEMQSQLAQEAYRPGDFERFKIYEPKERDIEAPAFEDKVVLHAITDNGLYSAITSSFIRNNCANQRGKGTNDAVIRLKHCLVRYYARYKTAEGWVLKADVRHFFASIDHDALKAKLQKVFDAHELDPQIYRLLLIYIDKTDGLPLGYQTSQLFALLMLDGLDHYITETRRFPFYVRGMDDFCIISRDKDELKTLLQDIRRQLADLHLELNEKTAIFPLKNGLDFLGYHTYLTETGAVVQKLRRSSIKRIQKRIKRWRHEYAEGKISAQKIKECYASWDSHAAFGDTFALRQKLAKEVSEIIGEPIKPRRKINSTRAQREARRNRQQRCIERKVKRTFASNAPYSHPDVPPWN